MSQPTIPLETVLEEMQKTAGKLVVDLAIERAKVRTFTVLPVEEPVPVEEEVTTDAAD